MKKRVTVKINLGIILIVALLFIAIILKLSYVVLSSKVDGVNLKELASSISTVERTLLADRGTIYDVNGQEFALSVNSYNVVAYLSKSRTTDNNDPRHVVDKKTTASKLAPILNMSEERLLELLNKENRYQVQLGPGGNGITEKVKAEIERLELPGIGFESVTKKRYYSQSSFASYIVGYAKNNDDGKIVGELGIEKYYDDILSGTNGYTKYLKYTSSNYQIPNTPSETEEAQDGSDIYLTIDSGIQMIAENAVSTLRNKYNAEWAVFTVMDANTGAIVASATNPNFDPNNIGTIAKSGYLNPLVSYQYEPGSVMKIFSFASAIEEQEYKGDELFKSGSLDLQDGAGTIIRDAFGQDKGKLTFDTGFAYSSNVAATILALRLGAEKLTNYYLDLGFGDKTGIELSNEVSGEINFQRKSELSNASFGQGISVTPIQMLQAISSMTNDGSIIKPYIVDKIVDNNGNITYEGKRTVVKKVYSTNTVEKMQELMYNMVYHGSNGKIYQPNNVTIMGKTGTAQVASGKGGYLTGKYDVIKSFAGIFPVENPKYIIYVSAFRPEVSSNIPWAKVITTAVEEIASYAKITESKSDIDPEKIINLSNYISKDVKASEEALEKQKLKPIVIGNGKYVINQYPLKNTKVLSLSKVFLLTNATEYKMADITGWSVNEVKTYTKLLGLKLEYTGHGYAKTQSIEKNTVLDVSTMTLKVEFE